MKFEWLVVTWNSGWTGYGKKMPSGEYFTLSLFLQGLEEEGWEIFTVFCAGRTTDREIIARKPR